MRLGATSEWKRCGRLVSEQRWRLQTMPLPARNFPGDGRHGGRPTWTAQRWVCQLWDGRKMDNGRWLGMRKCDGWKRCDFGALLRAGFTCFGGCPRMSLNFHGKEVWVPRPGLKVQPRRLEATRSLDLSTHWDVPHVKVKACPVGAHFGCGKGKVAPVRRHEHKESLHGVVLGHCRSWVTMHSPTC